MMPPLPLLIVLVVVAMVVVAMVMARAVMVVIVIVLGRGGWVGGCTRWINSGVGSNCSGAASIPSSCRMPFYVGSVIMNRNFVLFFHPPSNNNAHA